MSGKRQILCALACAATVAAQGAIAPAQVPQREKTQQEKPEAEKHATEVSVERNRIMIAPAPGPGLEEGGLVINAPGGGSLDFNFVASEMAFDRQIVRGAPYSAEAVTESVQVLGDGNRITHRTTARLYRDSEGRTRREQTLNGIGSWSSAEEAPQTVFINDPVAGVNYLLNPREKTALKLMTFIFTRTYDGKKPEPRPDQTLLVSPPTDGQAIINGGNIGARAINKLAPVYPPIAKAAGAEGQVRVEVTVDEQGNVSLARAVSGHPLLQQAAIDAARQWTFNPTRLRGEPVKVRGFITFGFVLDKQEKPAQPAASAPGEGARPSSVQVFTRTPGQAELQPAQRFPQSKESLGKQTFEGIEAEGTRTTVTIPAGAVGNDRAIQIVSERWYAPELQTVMMTRHSDPRFGETIYRLTNLNRAEPARSLFEVPSDYTVKESGPAAPIQMRIQRKEH